MKVNFTCKNMITLVSYLTEKSILYKVANYSIEGSGYNVERVIFDIMSKDGSKGFKIHAVNGVVIPGSFDVFTGKNKGLIYLSIQPVDNENKVEGKPIVSSDNTAENVINILDSLLALRVHNTEDTIKEDTSNNTPVRAEKEEIKYWKKISYNFETKYRCPYCTYMSDRQDRYCNNCKKEVKKLESSVDEIINQNTTKPKIQVFADSKFDR